MAKQRRKPREYTQEEINYLKRCGYTTKDIAFMLKRTEASVHTKKYQLTHPETAKETRRAVKEKKRKEEEERLGGRQYDFWTAEEIDIILTSKLTDAELSQQLSRTINSIQKKRHRLKDERRKS